VISSVHRQYRAVELKKVPTEIDAHVAVELEAHLICDDYAADQKPITPKWPEAYSPVQHVHHRNVLIVYRPARAVLCLRHR
jgi:hypothetical protein